MTVEVVPEEGVMVNDGAVAPPGANEARRGGLSER
jgi:hypothetical protein